MHLKDKADQCEHSVFATDSLLQLVS